MIKVLKFFRYVILGILIMLIFQFVLVLTIYGYDIDRIERKPTLVSLLIFTLSLPALYTESQSVGVPEYYFSSKGNMSKYLPNFFRCTLISKKKSIYS